jgi:hypothetical protein
MYRESRSIHDFGDFNFPDARIRQAIRLQFAAGASCDRLSRCGIDLSSVCDMAFVMPAPRDPAGLQIPNEDRCQR